MDEVIELDIKNDKHAVIYNYHEEMKTDSSRKMNSYSYAEYTTIDNIIVLWLQSKLLLIQSNQVIKWVSLKTSQPLQQRIRIDNEKRLCMVACRNEIFLFSLPDLVIENTHRDTINDIPFKSIDYLSKEDMILALPDTYKFGAPVFYLYPSKHKVDSQDCRDLQHSLYWGILHPSGNSIFFCDNEGGIIIFRKEMKDFIWSVRFFFSFIHSLTH